MRPKSTFVSPKRRFHCAWAGIILTTVFMLLSGCVYEPVPVSVPAPSTFDRAWSAAKTALASTICLVCPWTSC